MKNTRTLISSSIVSFIIMILGLFMLCMSRAPKITFDEPLIEGGGVEFDSVGAENEDFLKLLGEENNETKLTENAGGSTSNDDDLLNFLKEEDDLNTESYEPSSKSGDEGMEEILRLLELDDESSLDDQNFLDQTNSTEQLDALDFGESVDQTNETISSEKDAINNLSKEVDRLEGVLANRTTKAESLQFAINEYDQRISQYGGQFSSSGRTTKPIQTVSNYYEPTLSEESDYHATSNASDYYSSGNYEQSYDIALELFRNHQYEQAVDNFFQLLQQNPKHPLADNCQYWMGECRFAQGKYYQAVVEFNKVFAYDAPDKQDDSQLMLGLAFMKLGEINSARSELNWLVSCYTSSEYINTANRYLGQL